MICYPDYSCQGYVKNMHEFSLVKNIFDIMDDIAKKEKLARIDKINLIIGEMLQIIPETFIFAFNAVKKGTKYEKSELIIEFQPIIIECNSCKNNFTLNKNQYICPKCKNSDFKIISGKDFIIKSIEGE